MSPIWQGREGGHMKSKKGRGRKIAYGIIVGIVVLLNIAAWCFSGFSDWYIEHIFPIWVNTYGRFSGLFPFSVGEILLCLGVLLTAAAVLLAIVLLVCILIPSYRRRREKRLFTGAVIFYKIYAWILLGVCLIMTLNCTLLYHGDTFNNRYFSGVGRDSYDLEELLIVRNFVVCQCNELCGQMERDENGDIIYRGDMRQEAIRIMQALGEEYGGLSGFYPRPKPLLFSDFMCQQYMQGYYFPFSMEANYNDVMYLMNKPATLCHELHI